MNILIFAAVGLVLFLIINAMTPSGGPTRIQYNQFANYIAYQGNGNFVLPENRIHSVFQQGNNFYFLVKDLDASDNIVLPSASAIEGFNRDPRRNANRRMFSSNPNFEAGLIRDLVIAQNADGSVHVTRFSNQAVSGSIWDTVFMILPILVTLFLILIIWRSLAGRNSVLGMGKNRATVVMSSPVRFNDVAGIEEEKDEVREIVEFLRNPRKFLELGARIPKGFLLVGAPGTGKTLLAKAIAGEAGVPFFSISGSDFSEMLVGVGPSRMRDLFEQAKMNTPCIIFIDEIDSIAQMRGVSISSAGEENQQTLNQLLVQMDGFTKSEGVIVMAATNRPDVLDPALLRPGRFDRQIVVQMPDVLGREKILKVHAKNKPVSSDVDLKRVSQIISGFTGADIENLMNESAIIAAKKNRKKITMNDITEGINKVLLGPQKRSRIITEEDKKITAYHEAGHAVVSYILQPKHTVQEVSIIPRGMAAGYTLTNDKDDVTAHRSKSFLETQLAVYMGGRVAENIFIGDICTGAQQDLKVATNLAEKMVTSFGMSSKLGPLYYGRNDEVMLRGLDKTISDSCQELIDQEIKALMLHAQERASEVLTKHKKAVSTMVEILLERETIYAEDIKHIMDGKTKKFVVAQIEERAAKSKELEAQERIEAELEVLDAEIERIRQMAKAFHGAKVLAEEKLALLESNFELARSVIKSGEQLKAIPTLDNIDEYAKLIRREPDVNEEPKSE